jgi:uncharacterized protein (DUF885 family)
MPYSRRALLKSGIAATACLGAPSVAAAAVAPADANARLHALFDAVASDILGHSPETATSLGLDSGARVGLRRRLDDHSFSAMHAGRAACRSSMRRLGGIDRAQLSDANRIRCDAVQYALQLGADSAAFDYGDNSFASAMNEAATPYVVSQQTGSFTAIPEFLNSKHKIETSTDCDAYLARLDAFARQMDQESARVRRDTAAGVIAPDFILDMALGQLRGYRAQAPGQTRLVGSLVERAEAQHIAGDFVTAASRIVERNVFPAIDRQVAAVEAARAHANADAGVWKLPNGEAYYSWLLKVGTSTALTADQIHEMGLEQGRTIDAHMDQLLRAQGLTQGSVGDRMTALTRDARFVKPNTDAGRAEVIAYLESCIAKSRALLPRVSRMQLHADVVVRRVPPDIEQGAGLGYMNFAALDGSRPAIYYINLRDTSFWPTWTLPTLTAHETLPGHAWQGAYLAERHDEIPLIFSLMGFNAFVEGWALYAEQLVDELGYYADDPFGQLGYLQAQRFRAARLVVDTGLHAKRWTRDQAVQSLVEQTGRAEGAARSEIDRYVSTPGQACGYKVGHTELLRLREHARSALGERFDVRDFNDAVVQTAGVPLTVLSTAIDAYVARVGT